MAGFREFIIVIIIAFACIMVGLLFIFQVWIPFCEQRDYIMDEIASTSGREKKYWEGKLDRLYWRTFPFLKVFRKRKKRKNSPGGGTNVS